MKLHIFKTSMILGSLFLSASMAHAASLVTTFNLEPMRIAVHPSVTKSADLESCFHINHIQIEGDYHLVKRDKLMSLIEPLAIECQGNASVGALLKSINALLADEGYVTTQAYVSPQDIAKTKTLALKIVAGRIDNIQYSEPSAPYVWFIPRMVEQSKQLAKSTNLSDFLQKRDNWLNALDDEADRFTLFPPQVRSALTQTVHSGDILHMDRVQDSLDSLNKVPSFKAKAELAPGSKPSTSNIVIKNRIDDAFRIYAGYDTESLDGVDRLKFGTTVEKDNLIGINDIWGLTLKSGEDANEMSGKVAVPVGLVTLRGNGSWSETMSNLSPISEFFTTTWNASGGLDWVAYSSKTQKINTDFTMTHRVQKRYINGLELTPQKVTHVNGGVSYTHYFEHGSLSSRIGADVGVMAFNAQNDPSTITSIEPKAQFFKLEGSVNGSYVIPGKASFSSNLNGQWTAHTLFSDDQMSIGSKESVRGFSNDAFKADRGMVWRNEVTFALPVVAMLGKSEENTKTANPNNWMRTTLSGFNPYMFIDSGVGHHIANDIVAYKIGTGGGIRFGGPRVSFDLGTAYRALYGDSETKAQSSGFETYVMVRVKLF
jgi:hemolysin activation/secretion protein